MKFVVSDDELKEFIYDHYDVDFAKEIISKFDAFRLLVDEQLDIVDDQFYEIFEYCVHEALEGLK